MRWAREFGKCVAIKTLAAALSSASDFGCPIFHADCETKNGQNAETEFCGRFEFLEIAFGHFCFRSEESEIRLGRQICDMMLILARCPSLLVDVKSQIFTPKWTAFCRQDEEND